MMGCGEMVLPKDIVLDNGELNEQRIWKRERLYKGMNGRYVERFYLSPDESYIFKPLTNNDQFGKEVWVNNHILPLFPPIFPEMKDYSLHDNPLLSWIIFEDLGPLQHVFNEGTLLAVAKEMAWWHSLSAEAFPGLPLQGLKPNIEAIVKEISEKRAEVLRMVQLLNMDEAAILKIYSILSNFHFLNKKVLSHGDLHIGNYTMVQGKIKVLDWEHAHLNSPYWDIYHAIDLAHPIFPKQVTTLLRERILDFYLEHVVYEVDGTAFKQEYYLFAATFSIWMLLLIQKDLQAGDFGKWSKEELEREQAETLASLQQCSGALAGV